ncbi:hypothetical protein GCM10020370_50850 [Paenibacillus hodogayensis]
MAPCVSIPERVWENDEAAEREMEVVVGWERSGIMIQGGGREQLDHPIKAGYQPIPIILDNNP